MKRILGIALLLSVAYLLLFASPLQLEPVLKPIWSEDLSNPIRRAQPEASDRIGFRVGDIFGYVTSDGVVKYLNTVQFGLALDARRFINYSSVSSNLVVKDSDGRIVDSFSERGYPLLLAGRLFVVSTSRTALSERDAGGNRIWSREFGSIITCVSGTSDLLAVGLLDGTVEVLDRAGSVSWSYNPGGSRVAVIYGCALSPDGSHLAIASGLDPQRALIMSRTTTGYRLARAVTLSSESRGRIFMHLFRGVPDLYVEQPGGLMYVPTGLGRPRFVPHVDGSIRSVQERGDGTLVVTAVRRGSHEANLWLVDPPDSVVARLAFAGDDIGASVSGRSLFVAVGQELMRIDVLKR